MNSIYLYKNPKEELIQLAEKINNFLLLSTCERLELYTSEKIYNTSPDLGGRECLKHLILVSCGAESAIFGEIEILEQVRDSLIISIKNGHCSGDLKKYFDFSIQCAKRIRNKLSLKISIADLIIKNLQNRDRKNRIVVMGTGHFGKKLVSSLIKRGFGNIAIYSKNKKRAIKISNEKGVSFVGSINFNKKDLVLLASENINLLEVNKLKKETEIFDLRKNGYRNYIGTSNNLDKKSVIDLVEKELESLDKDLENKIIVITGGSSGIGLCTAEKLLSEKARVVIIGKNKEKLLNAKSELLKKYPESNLFAYQCDIRNEEEITSIFDKIKKDHGYIYGLVNNAGIQKRKNIFDASKEDWEEVINTNLRSVFLCSKEALNQMKEEESGSIISISSILGLSPSPEKIIYGISKAAIINLSNSIAKEFGRYNIRANTISPGYINTDFVKDYAREMDADEYSRLLDSTQIKRVGDPEDVANLIVFLLSKKSNWITGNNIIVDGGFLL